MTKIVTQSKVTRQRKWSQAYRQGGREIEHTRISNLRAAARPVVMSSCEM